MAGKRKKQLRHPIPNAGDRLDWQQFNLLENLLIFCLTPDRNAPPESGVEFRLNPPDEGAEAREKRICLLFKIDRGGHDPLIPNNDIKPDYMAFYVGGKKAICTIIEMKGRQADDLAHGIDQIKRLLEILKKELREHLPHKFSTRLKFQGVLLSPPNSQSPRKKLERESEQEFVIVHLQYPQKANLFPYVAKLNKDTETYIHDNRRHDLTNGFLENVLAHRLKHRVEDSFFTQHFVKATDRQGIYINYGFSDDVTEYAAFFLDNTRVKLGVKATEQNKKQLQDGLKALSIDEIVAEIAG